MISGNPQDIVSKNIGNAYRGVPVEYLHVTHDGEPSNYSVYRLSEDSLEYATSPAPTLGLPYDGEYQIALSNDKTFSVVKTNAVSSMMLASTAIVHPKIIIHWYSFSNINGNFSGISGSIEGGIGIAYASLIYNSQIAEQFGFSTELNRYWRTTDLRLNQPEEKTVMSFGGCDILSYQDTAVSSYSIKGLNRFRKFGFYVDDFGQQNLGAVPEEYGGFFESVSAIGTSQFFVSFRGGLFNKQGTIAILPAGNSYIPPNPNPPPSCYNIYRFSGCGTDASGLLPISTFWLPGSEQVRHPKGSAGYPNNENEYFGSISNSGDFIAFSNNSSVSGCKLAAWWIPLEGNYPHVNEFGRQVGWALWNGAIYTAKVDAFRYRTVGLFPHNNVVAPNFSILYNDSIIFSSVKFSPNGDFVLVGTKNSIDGSPRLFAFRWQRWNQSAGGAPYSLNGGWEYTYNASIFTPPVPIPGPVKCISFNSRGDRVIIAHENSPHISIYRWGPNGFGEKLPDCQDLIDFAQAAGKTNYVRSIAI